MNRGFRFGGLAKQCLGAARRSNTFSKAVRPLVAQLAVLPSMRTIPLINLCNIKASLPLDVAEEEEGEEPR